MVKSKWDHETKRKEAERERGREKEREEKEKLASKAEIVHAGNTEITPQELIKNAQFRYS
jgi:hypothetical protein